MRMAYLDPPYVGTARRYYSDQPTYKGEVDHSLLIDWVTTAGFDGWALSCSAKSLRDLLPLCPEEARVASWSKPHGAAPATLGMHNVWEPVIVVQGRRVAPGVRDHLSALPARGGGELPGRKPLAFCGWLFDLLGMQPGDELVDMFPGTGVVARAWRYLGGPAGALAWKPDGALRFSQGGCRSCCVSPCACGADSLAPDVVPRWRPRRST